MQPTPEIQAFISRIQALPPGPGVSIDHALQPSLDEESEFRKLFAMDRQNERISNPYVGLVDVFDTPEGIRTTRARVIQDDKDLSARAAHRARTYGLRLPTPYREPSHIFVSTATARFCAVSVETIRQ